MDGILIPISDDVRRDALAIHVAAMDADPEGEAWRWKYIRALAKTLAANETTNLVAAIGCR